MVAVRPRNDASSRLHTTARGVIPTSANTPLTLSLSPAKRGRGSKTRGDLFYNTAAMASHSRPMFSSDMPATLMRPLPTM